MRNDAKEVSKGQYSKEPFDTTTQSGLATLENATSFAVGRVRKAKHLDEVATYLAANEQGKSSSGNPSVELAEIAFEELKEDLCSVMEDCKECNSLGSFESLDESKPETWVKTTFTWLDNVMKESSDFLSTFHNKLKKDLKGFEADAERLKKVADNLPEDCAYFDAKDVSQTDIGYLLFESTSNDVAYKIGLAGSSFQYVQTFVVQPYTDLMLTALKYEKEQLKAGSQVIPTPSELNVTPVATLPCGTQVIANLNAGFKIVLDGDKPEMASFNIFRDTEFEEKVKDKRFELPTLNRLQIRTAIDNLDCLVKSFSSFTDSLGQLNENQTDAFDLVRTLNAGSFVEGVLDTEAFSQMLAQLKQAQFNLSDGVIFLNQYADLLARTLVKIIVILDAYVKKS